MKKTLLFISALLSGVAVFAQDIPNKGFENWTDNVTPVGWSNIVSADVLGFATLNLNVTDSVGTIGEGVSAIKVHGAKGNVLGTDVILPGMSVAGSNSPSVFLTLIDNDADNVPDTVVQQVVGSFTVPSGKYPTSISCKVKYLSPDSNNTGAIAVIVYSGANIIGGAVDVAKYAALTGSSSRGDSLDASVYAVTTPTVASVVIPITYSLTPSATLPVDSVRIILNTVLPSEALARTAGEFDELTVDGMSLGLTNIPAGSVGIESLSSASFNVSQNAPNPFDGTTSITFSAAAAADVTFTVVDLLGRVVKEQTINASAGVNTINFSAGSSAPGTYFYTISDGTNTVTKKMVISK
jgi:hypothetical protein